MGGFVRRTKILKMIWRENAKKVCVHAGIVHTHTHTHTHYVNALTQNASPKALLPGSTVRLPPMNMHAGNGIP